MAARSELGGGQHVHLQRGLGLAHVKFTLLVPGVFALTHRRLDGRSTKMPALRACYCVSSFRRAFGGGILAARFELGGRQHVHLERGLDLAHVKVTLLVPGVFALAHCRLDRRFQSTDGLGERGVAGFPATAAFQILGFRLEGEVKGKVEMSGRLIPGFVGEV